MNELRVTEPVSIDPMKDCFRGVMWQWRSEVARQAPQIKLDVRGDDASCTVKAKLPGVRQNDIDVRIDGNQLTISAELKQETEAEKGRRVLRSERQYGFASRASTLATDVDDAAAKAKVENGMLELTLPKKAESSAKEVGVT